jgi:hypothetical protein
MCTTRRPLASRLAPPPDAALDDPAAELELDIVPLSVGSSPAKPVS